MGCSHCFHDTYCNHELLPCKILDRWGNEHLQNISHDHEIIKKEMEKYSHDDPRLDVLVNFCLMINFNMCTCNDTMYFDFVYNEDYEQYLQLNNNDLFDVRNIYTYKKFEINGNQITVFPLLYDADLKITEYKFEPVTGTILPITNEIKFLCGINDNSLCFMLNDLEEVSATNIFIDKSLKEGILSKLIFLKEEDIAQFNSLNVNRT